MKLSGGPPDEVVHAWEDVKVNQIIDNQCLFTIHPY